MTDEARWREHLDREELTNLVFRFTQSVDRNDWEGMERCCGPRFQARASEGGDVLVDVDRLRLFIEALERAREAAPGGESQHRYHCPAVEVRGDEATIQLVGEVLHAAGGSVGVSGLRTEYRARREAAGWRLCALDVRYQWRGARERRG